jgi:hypothetical protein
MNDRFAMAAPCPLLSDSDKIAAAHEVDALGDSVEEVCE